MDVYVLLDVVWKEGGEVVGVRATLDEAKRLADQHARAEKWWGWTEWEEWTMDEGAGEWSRDRTYADGSTHASDRQQIVQHQMPESHGH